MRGTQRILQLGAMRPLSSDALAAGIASDAVSASHMTSKSGGGAYGFKNNPPQIPAESGVRWVKEKMFSWKEVIVLGVSVIGSGVAIVGSGVAMNLRTNERIDGVNTRIAGVVETVTELRVAQAKTDGRIELISHKVDTLTIKVDAVTIKVDAVTTKVDTLTTKVDNLTTGMHQLIDHQNRRWLGIF